MAFDLHKLLRPHISSIKPYSSARDEYSGTEGVFLDANENAFGTPGTPDPAAGYHRYPDPYQQLLKKRIAEIKHVPAKNIFLGNGSDEAIDLLIRAFCRPGVDNIVILPPTYGMYEVSAAINDVTLKKAQLTPDFKIDAQTLDGAIDINSKLLFFCSPNNPSGNLLQPDLIEYYLQHFEGVVVVDEAYIDFADTESWSQKLAEYPNLVVLQTMSKAWGMAALRLGMAFASEEIIAVLNKIKPPYNINALTQQAALKVLEQTEQQQSIVQQILTHRVELQNDLETLPIVEKIFPSDANFLLVKMQHAAELFHYLIDEKVIVRDRSKVVFCEGCLRITVGTADENRKLVEKMKAYQPKSSIA
ncbi:histidinol-phosphate aminotransferase [Catalinimonas alkaloidigena]|uniref:histidinol-phosphate transaminase n=1 Tax=Catalinimonas alkaloidigena TaxID=1075417 RepID=UPI0024050D2C|nr:histidinol-phosphate transaminase [Catalinimonas alkaloidigena]MDF9795283.1 histidinol-phosphate aminotransferase [Catalinimonas alkaloidigena]